MDAPDSNKIHRADEPVPPFGMSTPSDSSLVRVVSLAHELGLKVMLRPTLQVSGGTFSSQSIYPSDWSAWFESYRNFVGYYAAFAQANGFDQFCVGVELGTSTYPAHESDWRGVIAGVREVFSGPLVYAANWDCIYSAWCSFPWDAVDYAGLDAYYDLGTEGIDYPQVSDLVAAWQKRLVEIENWQASVAKPVLFVEIGYLSITGAEKQPYDGSRVFQPDRYPTNTTLQAHLYEAAFQALHQKEWLQGLYWWDWEPWPTGDSDDPSRSFRGFTPQLKPAEDVLRVWYGGQKMVWFYAAPTSASISANGAIKKNAATGSYSVGQRVHIVANAPSGYLFSSWEASGVSVEDQLSRDTYMTVTDNGWVKAYFSGPTGVTVKSKTIFGDEFSGVGVKIRWRESGRMRTRTLSTPSSLDLQPGLYKFTAPSRVRVDGVSYRFARWEDETGATLSGSTSLSYNLQSGKTFYAVYGPKQYKLTVYVKDVTTRKPVVGATVEITGDYPDQHFILTTNSRGKAVFNRIFGGQWLTVTIAKDGYQPLTVSIFFTRNTTHRAYLTPL
jgi:hypothetical protein